MGAASEDAVILAEFKRLALLAGKPVMDVFRSAMTVERKADLSPVTEADRAAEAVILEGLRAAFPHIPCVAEEECAAGLAPKSPGGAFFLVDPLDGTTEFIRRNTDFTINLALIRHGRPVVGLVYAPARGMLYGGMENEAYCLPVGEDGVAGELRPIEARAPGERFVILASRSHPTAATDGYLAQYEGADIVCVGSSLKFCLIAAGEADLYVRFGRTMEWDTAAGDAVLRAAGGITKTVEGKPLAYGKVKPDGEVDFVNPWFVSQGRIAI